MTLSDNTPEAGHAQKRLLLIDDDPVASDILLLRIAQACPLVTATAIGEPVAPPGYDIYVVDLHFAGRQEGVRLAESITATTPGAYVFLLSSYLEVEALKRAMGVQCAGAFDKRNPEDVSALLRTISEVASREEPGETKGPQGRRSIIGDMAALIREWNRRISAEQGRDR
jgi:DNA-binding NarL/FixJ family response regulator